MTCPLGPQAHVQAGPQPFQNLELLNLKFESSFGLLGVCGHRYVLNPISIVLLHAVLETMKGERRKGLAARRSRGVAMLIFQSALRRGRAPRGIFTRTVTIST